ncbi:type II toxin-antitoxin system MqsA family antitoxin [Geoalkalibacter halelectricus]|uniref:Type II toxin-antitoxin system MqsA family antitoxin n=1 Tax=Geoalkalibacter halelectricus TaxID=2847045 RepID=A0ABY5ZNX6_9BACT|nr:type II toxin-antitoxin system MqsA family antitoxin [Geoalkalibacter halelectricus]MDO3377821.1 type II toxin-antitoxin system MqsA family antitoxin [Geoalkalibacter halelectricus]UWZ79570.1 type II toxin-antitoxin system MqsA family antitoxin [Geoalkalibacter halelectricus]
MNDPSQICPLCAEGCLHAQIGKNRVEYKGQTAELDLHYSLCDACGSEQSDAAQLRTNKRAMMAFKKQVEGLLSGAEVRALRERLGINQAQAAQLFGGGPVAFSKYESDDVAQSEAMDKLLRLVADIPEALDYLKRRAGKEDIQPPSWTSVLQPVSQHEYHVLKIVYSSCPEPWQGWKKCA